MKLLLCMCTGDMWLCASMHDCGILCSPESAVKVTVCCSHAVVCTRLIVCVIACWMIGLALLLSLFTHSTTASQLLTNQHTHYGCQETAI